MDKYICPRCNYHTNLKGNIIKHLKNKKLCPLKKFDIDPKDYVSIILKENGSELEVIQLLDEKNERIRLLESNEVVQKYEETLKDRDNQIKALEEKIKQLEGKLVIAHNENVDIGHVDNSTNTTTNINNLNVNITPFWDPETDFLTDRDYIECLRQLKSRIIPVLVQKLHFNPNHPENYNMVITNLKTKYAKVFDGNRWLVYDEDELLEKLLMDREYLITEWTACNDSEKFQKWNEKWDNFQDDLHENERLRDKIKKEIKFALYNNKNLIEVK